MLVTIACAVALAAAVPAWPSEGSGGVAAAPAADRHQAAYERWRDRLERHGLYVGRDLLPEASAAAPAAARPTTGALRGAIERMQRRWNIWLRTTARGRGVAFKLKVRHGVPGWAKAHLRSIAKCESHENPRAVGAGGIYRGLYQFSFSTWRAVGGSGDPAAASRWEQTWRAWLLLKHHGAGHWPVCG